MRRAACARGKRLFVAHAGACEADLYWSAVQRRATGALERAMSRHPSAPSPEAAVEMEVDGDAHLPDYGDYDALAHI